MDVTEVEPVDFNNPLLTLPNVIITPHVGMATIEAAAAVSEVCARNVAAKFSGGEVKYIVV